MDDLVSPDSGSLDTGEGATRKRALVVAHAHVRVLEIWQILGSPLSHFYSFKEKLPNAKVKKETSLAVFEYPLTYPSFEEFQKKMISVVSKLPIPPSDKKEGKVKSKIVLVSLPECVV